MTHSNWFYQKIDNCQVDKGVFVTNVRVCYENLFFCIEASELCHCVEAFSPSQVNGISFKF
jgi:hypothetical protein